MGHGLSVPDGSLPVFSTGTEKEAHSLVIMTCRMGSPGSYYAPELADDQSLENLEAFSERLDKAHDLVVEQDRCTCVKP